MLERCARARMLVRLPEIKIRNFQSNDTSMIGPCVWKREKRTRKTWFFERPLDVIIIIFTVNWDCFPTDSWVFIEFSLMRLLYGMAVFIFWNSNIYASWKTKTTFEMIKNGCRSRKYLPWFHQLLSLCKFIIEKIVNSQFCLGKRSLQVHITPLGKQEQKKPTIILQPIFFFAMRKCLNQMNF